MENQPLEPAPDIALHQSPALSSERRLIMAGVTIAVMKAGVRVRAANKS